MLMWSSRPPRNFPGLQGSKVPEPKPRGFRRDPWKALIPIVPEPKPRGFRRDP